ncbi:MAG: type IV pilus assembly protein PilM [Bacillota bacterium]
MLGIGSLFDRGSLLSILKRKPSGIKRWYRRFLPPGPAVAGVDIGTREIRIVKVADVKVADAVPEVVAVGKFPTPPGVFNDRIQTEKLAVALKQAVHNAGVEIENAVTAIGGDKVIIRHMRLPVMPEKEIESAVKWEAERHIPIALEELVLRPVNLGEVAADGFKQLHILLIAAPLKTVHEYYHLFQQAGLRLVAIDLQAFALWRAFSGSYKMPLAGTVAILNIGGAFTQLTILRDGRIDVVRTIAGGGDTVTEAVAKTYNVDFAVAQRMKEEEGEILPVAGEVAATVEPAKVQMDFAIRAGMGELLREIRRNLTWYQSQNRESPVERIILSGGGAKLRGITSFLSDELGMHVDIGLPGVTVHSAKSSEGYDPSLAIAIGLALREVVG